MTRLAITLLHSILAALSLAGAGFGIVIGRASMAWDLGLYGVLGETSLQLFVVGLFTLCFGLCHLLGAWAWFAGRRWGGFALLGATFVFGLAAPAGVALVLWLVGGLIAADLMVLGHRSALSAGSEDP